MSFYIGQKVVCVDAKSVIGKPMPIFEGKTYLVERIGACRCGIDLDVGVPLPTGVEGTRCPVCNFVQYAPNYMFFSRRFVPLEDYEAMNELVKELTEPKLQEA